MVCSAVSSLKQKRRPSVEDGWFSLCPLPQFHELTRGRPQKSRASGQGWEECESSPAPTFSAEMKIERMLKWGRNGKTVERARGFSMHVPTARQKWCRHSHLRKETAHDLTGLRRCLDSSVGWILRCVEKKKEETLSRRLQSNRVKKIKTTSDLHCVGSTGKACCRS